jgi:hypothetical protein
MHRLSHSPSSIPCRSPVRILFIESPSHFDQTRSSTELVAQQIPQVQALLAGVSPAAPVANTSPVPVPVPVAVAPTAQAAPVTQPRNNPFLGGLNNVQAPAANGTLVTSNTMPATAQQLHVSTQPAADPGTCLIPDCKQPVHVDAKGMRTSDYCSMKHRE